MTTIGSDSVTFDTSADQNSEVEESRQIWCAFFCMRKGKVSRIYVRYKVCASYPSVVAHGQRTPRIATVDREEVITDDEKHACMSCGCCQSKTSTEVMNE